ncbi:coatomer subunit beta-2-like [Lolium rigidum]|uniref:coatomer subunit beta-2-like n=1 Tax=Lolium rigidum TaxID=89674 RepID=UPI001F5CA716|nr:coatomer subunit beta-2-like [Lolium rigidum]
MDKPCTLMIHFEKGSAAMANAINSDLEGSDVAAKTEAMKRAVMLLLNGETLPKLFLTVVRYVLPSEDHTVQKLMLLYLEIIHKRDPAGRVLPEMILVCQKLRHNLRHPNEYIRGVTLRFLCRLSEPEILEPLVPSILENLEHRHHFVRRHALSAISAIYRLPHGDQLIPDAPELVERALASEQDASARRNAFLMLCLCAQERALVHLFSNAQRVTQWPDLLQMAAVDLIRKVCSCPNRADKGRYIKIISSLLSSPSTAVAYECAGALVSLSSAPSDARAAANAYNKLLTSQSDSNVRLILLDRLDELRRSHRHVMVDVVMDVLRALAIPNLDVKRKVLDLVLGLLTPRNVKEVVLYLKKEAGKTKSGEYRRMLLQAIHECAVEVPKVAGSVAHLLMDFLGGTNAAAAVDVVLFVREIIATTTDPKLRVFMIRRLSDTFYRIRASRVCSIALSILGEYSLSLAEVERAISTIRQCLGDPPLSTVSEEGETTDPSKPAKPMVNSVTLSSRRPVVPADGTLSTAKAAISTPSVAPVSLASTLNLRSLILSGDFCLAAVVACILTKLVLRLQELQPSKAEANKACTGALLVMTSILQLRSSS